MNGPFIWYKNFGIYFFRFITIFAFDRRTNISLMDKTALHKCIVVKMLCR